MSCAACSARIEKVISKMEGVSSISVNLLTEKATVEYDAQKVNINEIIGRIEKIGYGASVIVGVGAHIDPKQESRTLKTKFIVSLIFCIPLLYFAMGPMISWFHAPIPGIFSPTQYPINYAVLLMLLTVPCVIAGYQFYKIRI